MKVQSDIMDSELGYEGSPDGNGVAICAHNISKVYKLYDHSIDRLKESLHPFRRIYHHDFHALKDVSFEIRKGETFGIIGKNGSGKSTLLKIIAGVLTPSGGNLVVRGKVSALLELGIGFNPDMTGLENIYFSGTIMGYSKEAVESKVDDILAFADIGDFIHQPVKTYSSGMFVRLAFAVATKVDPDILLVDEALAVGDMFFQSRCTHLMKKMIDDGVTLLFVSHDTTSVTNLCQRAVYLDGGRAKAIGNALEVTDCYLRDMRKLIYRATPEMNEPASAGPCGDREHVKEDGFELPELAPANGSKENLCNLPFKTDPAFAERAAPFRYGTGNARVTALELLNDRAEQSVAFRFHEWVTVRAYIEIHKKANHLNCCILIRNRNGVEIMHATSFESRFRFPVLKPGDRIVVDIRFRNILKGGEAYTIHYTVNDTEAIDKQEIMDLIELAAIFESLRDEEHPIWYLVYYPFQYRYSIIHNSKSPSSEKGEG
jgi:ABC-type polysaccharide/polyol phosphate transport system ATPase subunit